MGEGEILPGDMVVVRKGDHCPPALHERQVESRPGEVRFIMRSYLRFGMVGMVLCADEEMPCWYLLLVDGRLGWVISNDLNVLEGSCSSP